MLYLGFHVKWRSILSNLDNSVTTKSLLNSDHTTYYHKLLTNAKSQAHKQWQPVTVFNNQLKVYHMPSSMHLLLTWWYAYSNPCLFSYNIFLCSLIYVFYVFIKTFYQWFSLKIFPPKWRYALISTTAHTLWFKIIQKLAQTQNPKLHVNSIQYTYCHVLLWSKVFLRYVE
jgi:hypothetical protein